jgi:hypothetical protein
VMA